MTSQQQGLVRQMAECTVQFQGLLGGEGIKDSASNVEAYYYAGLAAGSYSSFEAFGEVVAEICGMARAMAG